MHTHVYSENVKGRDHFGDIDINGIQMDLQ
jgi:hypothetical protein